MRIIFIIGLILSSAVGIWHFSVPYIYNWYDYIPNAPKEIIVSIDWINYFFSLLLSGLSIILLCLNRKVFNYDRVGIVFYVFLVFIWFNRVVVTIVHPWEYNKLFFIQLISFIFIFLLLLIPLIYLIKNKKVKHK